MCPCLGANCVIRSASHPALVSNANGVNSQLLVFALAMGFTALFAAAAQSPSSNSRPSFEVASVRPNKSPDPHGYMGPSGGGRFTAINQTVHALLRVAYSLHDFQIIGGPKWLDTDRFDIVALTLASPRDFPFMLQSLLAERFNLQVHKEVREFPSFALVLQPNRRLAPGLRKSAVDCGGVMNEALQKGAPLPPVNVCGGQNPPGRLVARGMTMATLALHLSRIVGRHVVDRTGLPGGFDFDLKWTPNPAASPDGDAISMGDGPSIYTALQEQLGLQMRRTRGPLGVLVIDRVEHPTPN